MVIHVGTSVAGGRVSGVGESTALLADCNYSWDAASWLPTFSRSDEGSPVFSPVQLIDVVHPYSYMYNLIVIVKWSDLSLIDRRIAASMLSCSNNVNLSGLLTIKNKFNS